MPGLHRQRVLVHAVETAARRQPLLQQQPFLVVGSLTQRCQSAKGTATIFFCAFAPWREVSFPNAPPAARRGNGRPAVQERAGAHRHVAHLQGPEFPGGACSAHRSRLALRRAHVDQRLQRVLHDRLGQAAGVVRAGGASLGPCRHIGAARRDDRGPSVVVVADQPVPGQHAGEQTRVIFAGGHQRLATAGVGRPGFEGVAQRVGCAPRRFLEEVEQLGCILLRQGCQDAKAFVRSLRLCVLA